MRVAVRDVSELDEFFTLAPERYAGASAASGTQLGTIVTFSREAVRPGDPGPFVVLDTGNAADGFIASRPLQAVERIQSVKKRLHPGDVIVSRLRPYLRQIAYADIALFERFSGAVVCCSTEFYVLRPHDTQSAAFLVPFLLTPGVQAELARSQEGGHHPRVAAAPLKTMIVPDAVLAERAHASSAFARALGALRDAEVQRDALIQAADTSRS